MKAPSLSRLDFVAWSVFNGCATRWDTDFGQRTGLKYDQVKLVAETEGYNLNSPLLRRVKRLEMLTLHDDANTRKRKKARTESADREVFGHPHADEDAVN